MKDTIYLTSGKLNDTQFFIDVLYYAHTSYSKSLYPTIARYFKKYAMEYMQGGTYSSTEKEIDVPCIIDGYHSKDLPPYFIKRTIYTKK